MSPKIALVLLICSCVVLGLVSADRRQQRSNQARSTQQRRGRVNSQRRMLPASDPCLTDPELPQGTDGGVATDEEYKTVDETPSTQKPLAANRKDNKRPRA